MPHKRSPFARFWTVLAVLMALAIAVGSLMPAQELPEQMPWDKLQHLTGYGMLALLTCLTGVTRLKTLIMVFVYGVAVEYAQTLAPGRMGGDWADILANTLGALLGIVIATVIVALYLTMRRR
ncbi:VanZ family protein [Phytohalomonas tamaricis]|uniref:VanZ family protein n=1 Tax=Phytohalomonas tamaricis TaxID=2081032 RepID=UPI000D0B7375|nr:VanZ family protein [Phytohalomonas tamaricis]